MRILYLLPHPNMTLTDPVGHAVRIRELKRGFEQLGGEVFVVCAGERPTDQAFKKIYRTSIKRGMPERLSGTMRDLFYIGHDHLFRRKALAEARSLKPLDFILEHYTFFHQTGAYLAKQLKLPLVLDDIPPAWEDEVYYRRDLRKVARRIQDRVFKEATVLIAVSGTIRDYLLSNGVSEKKVHIVANGADCTLFRPGIGGAAIREHLGIKDQVVVGFVGSFAPWHGVDLLIRCAGGLDRDAMHLHFLIVGDGPRRAELEKTVHASGMSNWITFTGAIPFDQIPPYIDAMDIAVMPDSNIYGSPIKIFEYMAMEKAVIAPRLDPIEEIITDGSDGVLFTPRDHNALRQAVFNLYTNKERRKEMGRNGRKKVLEQFTWVKHAETIGNLAKSFHHPFLRTRDL